MEELKDQILLQLFAGAPRPAWLGHSTCRDPAPCRIQHLACLSCTWQGVVRSVSALCAQEVESVCAATALPKMGGGMHGQVWQGLQSKTLRS